MKDAFAVDLKGCRARQARLLEQLQSLDVEHAILMRPESVQWLTGAYVSPLFTTAAAISADGNVTLVVPAHIAEMRLAASQIIPYDGQWLATIRDEQLTACRQKLLESLPHGFARIGAEFSYLDRTSQETLPAGFIDIEEILLHLRRRKDPDELRMLARANEANQAMYEHARSIIEPGIAELDVYNLLHTVATNVLREPISYFGQDFQCCSPGGPPRDRVAKKGELYILDLGVGYRGYRSDNCRTFSVDGHVSGVQQEAWEAIAAVFPLIELTVRPGVNCKSIYEQVNSMLADFEPGEFSHHLGHGVGLAPHEGPRLNPNWDDPFEQGNYFTVEPGLYHDELRQGIRLEQNYVVTADGVELVTPWPLEM